MSARARHGLARAGCAVPPGTCRTRRAQQAVRPSNQHYFPRHLVERKQEVHSVIFLKKYREVCQNIEVGVNKINFLILGCILLREKKKKNMIFNLIYNFL